MDENKYFSIRTEISISEDAHFSNNVQIELGKIIPSDDYVDVINAAIDRIIKDVDSSSAMSEVLSTIVSDSLNNDNYILYTMGQKQALVADFNDSYRGYTVHMFDYIEYMNHQVQLCVYIDFSITCDLVHFLETGSIYVNQTYSFSLADENLTNPSSINLGRIDV